MMEDTMEDDTIDFAGWRGAANTSGVASGHDDDTVALSFGTTSRTNLSDSPAPIAPTAAASQLVNELTSEHDVQEEELNDGGSAASTAAAEEAPATPTLTARPEPESVAEAADSSDAMDEVINAVTTPHHTPAIVQDDSLAPTPTPAAAALSPATALDLDANSFSTASKSTAFDSDASISEAAAASLFMSEYPSGMEALEAPPPTTPATQLAAAFEAAAEEDSPIAAASMMEESDSAAPAVASSAVAVSGVAGTASSALNLVSKLRRDLASLKRKFEADCEDENTVPTNEAPVTLDGATSSGQRKRARADDTEEVSQFTVTCPITVDATSSVLVTCPITVVAGASEEQTTTNTEAVALQAQVDTLQAQLAQIISSHSTLQLKVTHYESTFDAQDREWTGMHKEFYAMQDELASAQAAKELDLEVVEEQHSRQVQKMQTKLEAKTTALRGMEQRVQTLEQERDGLVAARAQLDTNLGAVADQLNQLQAHVASTTDAHQQQVAVLEAAIVDARLHQFEIQCPISVAVVEEIIVAAAVELQPAPVVDVVMSSEQECQTEVDTAAATKALEMEAQMATQQSELTSVNQRLEALEAESRSLHHNLDSKIAECTDLSERLTSLESENDRLQKQVPTEKMILKLVKHSREVQKKSENEVAAVKLQLLKPVLSAVASGAPAPMLAAVTSLAAVPLLAARPKLLSRLAPAVGVPAVLSAAPQQQQPPVPKLLKLQPTLLKSVPQLGGGKLLAGGLTAQRMALVDHDKENSHANQHSW